jgi:hypothetical protein
MLLITPIATISTRTADLAAAAPLGLALAVVARLLRLRLGVGGACRVLGLGIGLGWRKGVRVRVKSNESTVPGDSFGHGPNYNLSPNYYSTSA